MFSGDPSNTADRYAALCLNMQLPCHPKPMKIDMFTCWDYAMVCACEGISLHTCRAATGAMSMRDRAALSPTGTCGKQASFVSCPVSPQPRADRPPHHSFLAALA